MPCDISLRKSFIGHFPLNLIVHDIKNKYIFHDRFYKSDNVGNKGKSIFLIDKTYGAINRVLI